MSDAHFHNKGFALSLVLKVRVFGTRQWPIKKIDEEAISIEADMVEKFGAETFIQDQVFVEEDFQNTTKSKLTSSVRPLASLW